MSIGYIILCRFNSSRLPGKILRKINGKPLLEIILDRLEPLGRENIILATSTESTDDPIADWCKLNGVKFYRGSLDNVAERFLKAARWGNFDYAVRINGDNLFADGELIKSLAERAASQHLDFLSNVPQRTFPTGMSIEVVKTDFYESSMQKFNEEKYFEHVTLYFYEHPEILGAHEFVTNTTLPFATGMKMAIDTEEDFKKAEKIMNILGAEYKTADWKKIVQLNKELL